MMVSTIDSADFKHTFFGIVNRQGQLWTPVCFGARTDADEYLRRHAVGPLASIAQTHRIVPVRARLEVLPAPAPHGERE